MHQWKQNKTQFFFGTFNNLFTLFVYFNASFKIKCSFILYILKVNIKTFMDFGCELYALQKKTRNRNLHCSTTSNQVKYFFFLQITKFVYDFYFGFFFLRLNKNFSLRENRFFFYIWPDDLDGNVFFSCSETLSQNCKRHE